MTVTPMLSRQALTSQFLGQPQIPGQPPPPGAMTQNLLPSPFPFASSHIARPVLSGSGSTYAAATAQ